MDFYKIGIVGSGIMGSSIAELVIEAGYQTILRSRQQQSGEKMLDLIYKSFERKISKGVKAKIQAEEQLSNLQITESLDGFSDCDLVIESVVEDLEIKKTLFGQLDKICKSSAILASNTSTLPVVDFAAVTQRPEQVCGIHFFNPATVMPAVEIVRTLVISQQTLDDVTSFVRTLGKEPIEVKDQAGFVVNALLFPYLNNAIKLLERGVASKEAIDNAMKGGCGFPMGPFALLDLIGLDTSLSILNALYKEFGEANYAPAPLLKRMVAARMYGCKSKSGFYSY
ncbi:MAG: 3-hydroxyacyl-CoA dehydrogenase family protein [Actinobacteria bacterium]|nr:3-hydroxyacyl-CoA dehydrogenase family protein [Actinomycetota bacterium]